MLRIDPGFCYADDIAKVRSELSFLYRENFRFRKGYQRDDLDRQEATTKKPIVRHRILTK